MYHPPFTLIIHPHENETEVASRLIIPYDLHPINNSMYHPLQPIA